MAASSGRFYTIDGQQYPSVTTAPGILRTCGWCGGPFRTWPSELAKGKGKLCSKECHSRSLARPKLPPVTERFWQSVDKSGECWLWMGTRRSDGYGVINISTRKEGQQRFARAHRVAWELTHGPIPEGLFVCHRCDNPSCVRPEHLFLGNARDNGQDMAQKGRGGYASHPERYRHGECMDNAKLTNATAAEIRQSYARGEANQCQLARRYGVSRRTIRCVLAGTTWRHMQ